MYFHYAIQIPFQMSVGGKANCRTLLDRVRDGKQ
jgi:hypothetical protein